MAVARSAVRCDLRLDRHDREHGTERVNLYSSRLAGLCGRADRTATEPVLAGHGGRDGQQSLIMAVTEGSAAGSLSRRRWCRRALRPRTRPCSPGRPARRSRTRAGSARSPSAAGSAARCPWRRAGDREPGGLDVVGGGVRPGVPAAEHDGQRLPVPARAVVGPGVIGWNRPKGFFQVGACPLCLQVSVRSRWWRAGR
jgi:hypothetical protein